MTGKEKILDRIRSDGESAVESIRAESALAVEAITADGVARAKKESAIVLEKGEKDCQRIIKNAQSADELYLKTALLICRRRQIDKTLNMAIESMCSMPDGDYFDMLVSMAGQYSGLSGELLLNSKDLARKPGDLAERFAAKGVSITISQPPCDIVGGFILKCGDIEYCADFTAILEEKRDQLEDMVNRELFKG